MVAGTWWLVAMALAGSGVGVKPARVDSHARGVRIHRVPRRPVRPKASSPIPVPLHALRAKTKLV